MLTLFNKRNKDQPIELPLSNQKLTEVVTELLNKAKTYKSTISRENRDHRILLEIYGLASGLCRHIDDVNLKSTIEKKIIKAIEEFVIWHLKIVSGVALDNLDENLKTFKRKIAKIRAEFGSLEDFFKDLVHYLQDIIGKPEGSFAFALMGSLASGMSTPYSDIEYFVLVDKITDANKTYFENLAFLIDLIMLSLGETPIYKAQYLLKEYEAYYPYFKTGIRMDKHKEPDDKNRLFGLINTPEELLIALPTPNKIIHKPGNHLTAALLTSKFLMGKSELYSFFADLCERALESQEYLECLRVILHEDIRATEGILQEAEENYSKKPETVVDSKKLLNCFINLAKTLSLFLISSGENLKLHTKFVDITKTLKSAGYISAREEQAWDSLTNKLYLFRLNTQLTKQNSSSKVTLNELKQKIDLTELLKTLQQIIILSKMHLEKRANVKNLTAIKKLIDIYVKQERQYQKPMVNDYFIMRPQLWQQITQYFLGSQNPISTLVLHGLGGMGKRQLAQHYYHHSEFLYGLRAYFRAESLEMLSDQYVELGLENGLSFPDKMPVTDKALLVKGWLEQQKNCLLVYINVPNPQVIVDLLPQQGKHHILVTSRNEVDWKPSQRLKIAVMHENEAIELVNKRTGIKESELVLQKLVGKEYLGCSPLAIAQAAAFMAKNNTSAEDYLKIYDSHKATILNDISLIKEREHEPIWITFDINFTIIGSKCPAALRTLKQASWINGSLIDEELLKSIILTPETSPDSQEKNSTHLLWAEIKGQLGLYSLMNIDVAGKRLSIHPVLQEILLSKQIKLEKKEVLSEVFAALEKVFWQNEPAINETAQRLQLPHLEKLEKHFKEEWPELIVEPRDELGKLIGELLNDIAFVHLYGYNNLKKAEEFYKRVLPIFESIYGKESASVAKVLGNMGNLYEILKDNKQLILTSRRALAIFQKDLESETSEALKDSKASEVACAMINLGILEGNAGDIAEKKRLMEAALAIELSLKGEQYGPDGVRSAYCLGNLANVYMALQRIRTAQEYFEKAFRIFKIKKDENSFEVALTYLNLGNIFSQLGEFQKATEYLGIAMKYFSETYPAPDLYTAKVLDAQGVLEGIKGNTSGSITLLEEALKTKQECSAPKHSLEETLRNLGDAYLESGNLEKADEQYEKVKRINAELYSEGHILITNGMIKLGKLYLKNGNLEKAKLCLEPAFNSIKNYYGPQNINFSFMCLNLVLLYQALEEASEKSSHLIVQAIDSYVKDTENHHYEAAKLLSNFKPGIENAENILEEASALLAKEWGTGHKQTKFLQLASESYKLLYAKTNHHVIKM